MGVMTFGAALAVLKAGGRVRRLEWPEDCHIRFSEQGTLERFLLMSAYTYWTIKQVDVLTEDWVTLDGEK